MMAATFTGMGRGKADPEEQFIGDPGEDTEEDFPLVLEDADNIQRKVNEVQVNQRVKS